MEGNNDETLLDAEDKGQTQSQKLPGKTMGSTWQADNAMILQSQPNSEGSRQSNNVKTFVQNFHVSETITLNENPMCLY